MGSFPFNRIKRPILTLFVASFVVLVILSVFSMRITIIYYHHREELVDETRTITSPSVPSVPTRSVCVVPKETIQKLYKQLMDSHTKFVVDVGASIGEVSLPLVKQGFHVFSVETPESIPHLARLRAKLSRSIQDRWIIDTKLPSNLPKDETIYLIHNLIPGIQVAFGKVLC